MRKLGLIAVLSIAGAGLAHAQPYYPPHYYDHPPPRDYRPGFNCEAFVRRPERPHRYFCPIERPLPVGTACACPGPLPPPGYPPYPPIGGHVVP